MTKIKDMNLPIMVKVSGVKKMYKLGQIGGGTLQADLQSWWAKKKGKDDPNTKIGQEKRLVGQNFMALNGIDLDIYQGEAVGIIGGNGAGKSTLLKLISQVTAPTSGKIELFGRVASMLEVGTGFNGEMTGRENIYMNGAILGMTKAEIDSKMEDIIEFSEVRDFIDTPVKRYSSGMYVKLAFSVAAHLDSEIMIMDEVLAVGDMAFQKKCLEKMRDAAKEEGRTVLYVSHNMNTIRQLCDRCIVLDKGKVVFQGSVEKSIAVYFGNDVNGDDNRNVLYTPKHKHEFCDGECVIERIEFKVSDATYKQDDTIAFKMEIGNHTEVKRNYYLRLVIRSDIGIIVSMACLNKPLDLQYGANLVDFELCLRGLAPAGYSITFVLYEIGELGTNRNVDVLRDIYSFVIMPNRAFNHGMEWLSQYWGYYTGLELKTKK